MNKRVTAIVEEARKLTHEERLDLLELLHIEFSDDAASEGTPKEIEAAWVEEVERRIEMRERGETVSVDHDEIMLRLRSITSRQ